MTSMAIRMGAMATRTSNAIYRRLARSRKCDRANLFAGPI